MRAGLVVPVSASGGDARDYDPGAFCGLYFRPARANGSAFSYEVGLDVAARGESDGYESLPLGGHLDVLFDLGGYGGPRLYLLSGLTGFAEFVNDQLTGEEYTNYAGTLDLGAGLGLADGRLEVRVAHGFALGSGNVRGVTMLSVGFGF